MSDHVPDVLAELDIADNTIAPEIRGMQDTVNDGVTNELMASLNNTIVRYQTRRDLIRDATLALEALVADGYPALDRVNIPQDQFDELQKHTSDVQAGASIFDLASIATFDVTIEPFVDKPSTSQTKG